MNVHQSSSATLSAAEYARLDSFMLEIAGKARGSAVYDGSGNWRFGSKGGLCVYANGQFHDFSGGAREHGHNALQLIQHLLPNEDAIAWARDWLAQHPGNGAFVAGEGEPVDDFAEAEAMAYVEALYNGAERIDDTPGYTYITQTRGLPLRPEDQTQLRWIAGYRGDEGALLAPVTDDDGKLVKLMVTHVTIDGQKSPHGPDRTTIRGTRRPGLYRLGTPAPNGVETEGVEKGLAARAAGGEYVVVSGGGANLGKVPLPTVVSSIVIARDADPAGSPADMALWRAVVRRLGQGLKVTVTSRPNDLTPNDAPFLKDLDDLWRHDPELVSILLKGANLEHGRLGDAVDSDILDLASRLDAVALGRARPGIAKLLGGISLGTLDDAIKRRIKERLDGRDDPSDADGVEPWPEPVTDIGAVLDAEAVVLRKILAAPATHHDAIALWSAHTHLLLRKELGVRHSSRLAFQSQFEDSGKTTALTTLLHTAARPMGTGSLSGASLYRETDAHHWTVLWDEADTAFHLNTAPELVGVFNAGHDRKFAVVHRQAPHPDGGMETQSFDTFTGIALTAIKAFPSRAMQSRCIVLPMKRATKAEANRLEEFNESHEAVLTECGRKFTRWAADLPALPQVDKADTGLINRIWLNWRPLLQIAELAGGDWPARALTAAQADMKRVTGEKDDSDEYALLAAIWRVLARDTSIPRQMYTADLIRRLLEEDEGRWRTAGKNGKEITSYYISTKVRRLLPTEGEYAEPKTRQWRSSKDPKAPALHGYNELHFEDAFSRYLDLGLPSKDGAPGAADAPGPSPSPDTGFPPEEGEGSVSSATSATGAEHADISGSYHVADTPPQSATVADKKNDNPRRKGRVAGEEGTSSATVADEEGTSATEETKPHQEDRPSVADVADKSAGKPPSRSKGKPAPTRKDRGFPVGPAGRKARAP